MLFGKKIEEGDIVLYDDEKSSDPRRRNLITKVLDPLPGRETAIIRFHSTTMVVCKKYLQVLNVSEFPLQVPTEAFLVIRESRKPGESWKTEKAHKKLHLGEKIPVGWELDNDECNKNEFASIPLDWFDYTIDAQKEKPEGEPSEATK